MNRRATRLDDKLNILLIAAAAVAACVIAVGNAEGMAFGTDGRLAAAHVTPATTTVAQQPQTIVLASAR